MVTRHIRTLDDYNQLARCFVCWECTQPMSAELTHENHHGGWDVAGIGTQWLVITCPFCGYENSLAKFGIARPYPQGDIFECWANPNVRKIRKVWLRLKNLSGRTCVVSMSYQDAEQRVLRCLHNIIDSGDFSDINFMVEALPFCSMPPRCEWADIAEKAIEYVRVLPLPLPTRVMLITLLARITNIR